MTDHTPTPSRLWKRMTGEQRLRAAQALWREQEAAAEQREAALLIAKHLKFRPKTVHGLDPERKARHLAAVGELPDALAARVLVLYHLAEQRPMMGAFLDALGIAHDDGLIHEDAVAPDAGKIPEAVAAIARDYPPQDVSIYLTTLLWQDPASWGALAELPEVAGGERSS
jgi:hypothetical protein